MYVNVDMFETTTNRLWLVGTILVSNKVDLHMYGVLRYHTNCTRYRWREHTVPYGVDSGSAGIDPQCQRVPPQLLYTVVTVHNISQHLSTSRATKCYCMLFNFRILDTKT